MHFFNPVAVMHLVEVVRGPQTDDATVDAAVALAKRLGKTPVVVKDAPGFVVNRLLCPMLNEAVLAYSQGIATASDIDEAMKLGCNHPIGPLALCDLIGLDVVLAVMKVFHHDFKDPKYRPAPLLEEMVAAGHLGRKSGRGFYTTRCVRRTSMTLNLNRNIRPGAPTSSKCAPTQSPTPLAVGSRTSSPASSATSHPARNCSSRLQATCWRPLRRALAGLAAQMTHRLHQSITRVMP